MFLERIRNIRKIWMLVLSRKVGESIVLPDCQITITVIGVHGNRIRLGISAPKAVSVHRAEVWARVGGEPAGRNSPQPTIALLEANTDSEI